MRQHAKSHRAAVSLDGVIHPLGLERESPAVVIVFAVNQQKWVANFISVHKRADGCVDLFRIPQTSSFRLKTERRKCAIVRAAASNPGAEQVGMCQ